MIKSGFVTIVGKPNAGKSTLINQIFKKKISIATPKQNTTRNRINAIYNRDDLQISFIDTPGFLNINNKLDEQMIQVIRGAIKEVDIVIFLLDANQNLDVDYLKTIELIEQKTKKYLIINKIDLVSKKELLDQIQLIQQLNLFDEIIPISALKNKNVDVLLNQIEKDLPKETVKYFPDDQQVTYSQEFYASEIIREKILFLLNQEIPHEIFVKVTEFETKTKKIHIRAEIIVARESLKKIVIGRGGSMIKEIGIKARKELEEAFEMPLHLELFVKVRKDWKNKESIIKTFY